MGKINKYYNKKTLPISIYTILISLIIYTSSIALIKNNPAPTDINQYIKKAWNISQNVNERFIYFSHEFLGTKYTGDPLGEDKKDKIDKDPLFDFNNVDCVTFIEQCLALSISKSYKEFTSNLNKIRYKNGKINYISRNHYSILDWLPNNKWIVTDITECIGGKNTAYTKRTIDKQKFFSNKGIKVAIKPITLKTSYIPKEKIKNIKDKLKEGLILFHVGDVPGIIVLHWGILIKDPSKNNFLIRHASSIQNKVVDEELFEYLKKYKFIKGLKFIKIKDI